MLTHGLRVLGLAFGGIIPMIREKSLQARFLIPMAVSLGFRALFAIGITLVLIPYGYPMLEDLCRAGRAVHRLLFSRPRGEAQGHRIRVKPGAEAGSTPMRKAPRGT